MKTIWKFPLEIKDVQEISVPAGAGIMTVQMQGGRPCLWAHLNQQDIFQKRRIFIVGTGHSVPEVNVRYIGTFQTAGGALVFHAFEDLS